MVRVYRTASDAKGHFSYPEYLRDREIARAVITSAVVTPDIRVEKPGEGYRPLDLPHAGYCTHTEFRREPDAWQVSFDLIPTADLKAADGDDDATYYAIQRDLGFVQYFALNCALSDWTESLPWNFLDRKRLGHRRAERLANSYTFAPRRSEHDLAVRVRWTLPHASLRGDPFVENLAVHMANAERAFPPPVSLRLYYVPRGSRPK